MYTPVAPYADIVNMTSVTAPRIHITSALLVSIIAILLILTSAVAAGDKVCSHCEKKITEGHWIEFEGRFFHPDHFICANCSGDLRDGSIYVEGGRMYDSECYFDLFVSKCDHCGKPIVGNYTELDSNLYHMSCYEKSIAPRCGICGEILHGQYLIDHRGNMIHVEHADDYPSCVYCGSALARHLTGHGETYPDGRSVCGLCLKTTVNDIGEAKVIMADIIKVLAKNGINIDEKKVPLELVDRYEMLRKSAGFHDDPAGFTSYKRTSVVPGIWSHRDFKIYLLKGIPRVEFMFTLAHELMHVWLFKNASTDMSPVLIEGSCQFAGGLAIVGQSEDEKRLVLGQAMKNPDAIYGEGLRQVDAYVKRVGISVWLEYLKDHTDPPW